LLEFRGIPLVRSLTVARTGAGTPGHRRSGGVPIHKIPRRTEADWSAWFWLRLQLEAYNATTCKRDIEKKRRKKPPLRSSSSLRWHIIRQQSRRTAPFHYFQDCKWTETCYVLCV